MQLMHFGIDKNNFMVTFTYEEFNELSRAYSNLKESYKESMQRIAMAVLNKDLDTVSKECRIGEGLCKDFGNDIAELYRIETPGQRYIREWEEHNEEVLGMRKLFEEKVKG